MSTYQGHLLARSPFYITEVGSAGFTSTLNITIWRGSSASPPSTTYSISKQAIDENATRVNYEVSKLLQDFPWLSGRQYEESYSSNQSSYWVTFQTTGGTTNRDDIYLFTNGWSKYTDGLNTLGPESCLMMDSRKIYIPKVSVPGVNTVKWPIFYGQGSERYDSFIGKTYNGDFTQTFNTTQITINSTTTVQHQGTSNYLSTAGGSDTGQVWIDYFEFYDGATLLETLYVENTLCTEHEIIEGFFENRYGVLEQFYFIGRSTKGLTVSRDKFQHQVVYDYSIAPTYSTETHQFSSYNEIGKQNITINTGFVGEDVNETMNQMMVSNKVWLTIDGIVTPVIIRSSNIQYKNGVTDSLINYSFDCEYAFNTKNSVY